MLSRNLLKPHYLRLSQFSSCGAGKNLTKFIDEIEKEIMGPMPIKIAKPTLRPTKKREEYSDSYDRTKNCSGCSKCGDWERDTPLMTIQEGIREASRCLKC